MDQNTGGNAGNGRTGSEDTSEARRHVHNVEENREALEAQNRRVENTTPDDVANTPIQPSRATSGNQGGMSAGGSQGGGTQGGMSAGRSGAQGSEDASEAREHVRNVEENRDALEAQNRRVEETAPEETRHDLRDR